MSRNHEFGFVSQHAEVIATCGRYFDDLWSRGGADLTPELLDRWDQVVTRHRASGGRPDQQAGLGDFGADAGFADPTPFAASALVADAPQAFGKFLGVSSDRAPLSFSTIEEIKRAGCHWAVAYPAAKRPRNGKDDAIMFIGRLTHEPHDIRIFGRAIGMRHVPVRDDATQEDIALRAWKATWLSPDSPSGATFRPQLPLVHIIRMCLIRLRAGAEESLGCYPAVTPSRSTCKISRGCQTRSSAHSPHRRRRPASCSMIGHSSADRRRAYCRTGTC